MPELKWSETYFFRYHLCEIIPTSSLLLPFPLDFFIFDPVDSVTMRNEQVNLNFLSSLLRTSTAQPPSFMSMEACSSSILLRLNVNAPDMNCFTRIIYKQRAYFYSNGVTIGVGRSVFEDFEANFISYLLLNSLHFDLILWKYMECLFRDWFQLILYLFPLIFKLSKALIQGILHELYFSL